MTQRKYPPMTPWQVGSNLMWSLGEFKPLKLNGTLEVLFDTWLQARGICSKGIHVRHPGHEWSLKHTRYPQDWHKDGITWGSTHLIVWSNSVATEIQDTNGKVYQGAPYEVIAFNNQHFRHKPPTGLTNAQKEKRWFIRTEISPKTVLKDVPGLYACTRLVAEAC